MTGSDAQRFRRDCEHLHRLGARVLAEFIAEAALRLDRGNEIRAMLSDYCRLTPDVAFVVGADRFPPAPLKVVPR